MIPVIKPVTVGDFDFTVRYGKSKSYGYFVFIYHECSPTELVRIKENYPLFLDRDIQDDILLAAIKLAYTTYNRLIRGEL